MILLQPARAGMTVYSGDRPMAQSSQTRRRRRVMRRPHPLVQRAAVSLAILYVLAAWGFSGQGYGDYLLTVVTGVFAVTFGLAWVFFGSWRRWQTYRRADSTNGGFHKLGLAGARYLYREGQGIPGRRRGPVADDHRRPQH